MTQLQSPQSLLATVAPAPTAKTATAAEASAVTLMATVHPMDITMERVTTPATVPPMAALLLAPLSVESSGACSGFGASDGGVACVKGLSLLDNKHQLQLIITITTTMLLLLTMSHHQLQPATLTDINSCQDRATHHLHPSTTSSHHLVTTNSHHNTHHSIHHSELPV